MHLAVSSGLRCVSLFSGRDYPGLWDPYGEGHIVLRKHTEMRRVYVESMYKIQ